MRIGIVSLGAFPDSHDGSAKYIRGVFDELKRRDHDVTLYTAKWGSGFDDPNIVTVDVTQSRFLWVPKFTLQIKKLLKNSHFDVLLVNGSRAAIPVLWARLPYIGLIHDLGPFEADFTKIPILKWLEKKNARTAKLIITNSNITKQGIINVMGASSEKVFTVYCGYDNYLKPEPEKAQKIREEMALEGPIIYYVGRIAFYKGVEDIIRAYHIAKKKIPNLNLVIGGKPTLKMKEKYKEWKERFPDVKFIGLVKDEDMAAYYSLADIFTTYSWASEGFGITPVEAIACGAPVITSTMPAYQEILEDNAVFVEKQSPDKLAETYVKYLQNPALLKKMLQKSRIFIDKYTWVAVVDRIEKVFHQFIQDQNKE